MRTYITTKELEELYLIDRYDGTEAFNQKLKEMFDIEIRPYTAYQYFVGDSFVGDSSEYSIADLISNMGIKVVGWER